MNDRVFPLEIAQESCLLQEPAFHLQKIFFVRRIRDRFDLEETRIDIVDDFADDAALTGRAPALENDHDGEFGFLKTHLIAEKAVALGLDLLFEFFFVRESRTHVFLQHDNVLSDRQRERSRRLWNCKC